MSFVAINPLGVNRKVKLGSFSFQITQVANAKETLNLRQIEKAMAADCEGNELVIVGEIAVASLIACSANFARAEVVNGEFFHGCFLIDHVIIIAYFRRFGKGVNRTLEVRVTVPFAARTKY